MEQIWVLLLILRKKTLVIRQGPTQELEHTLTAEKNVFNSYLIANGYLFVNGTEIYKFKAKDSEIVATTLGLGNISKEWSVDNMKKTGFTGYVYDFSVDYDATAVDDILDIQ